MDIREKLAEAQHCIWSDWMECLFQDCIMNSDGSATIPAEKVKHWKRQIETWYPELGGEEQESDRHQADKVLLVIKNHAAGE